MSSQYEADPKFVKWTEDETRCIFKPRGLSYVWGNEPHNWIIPEDEERPAELIKVCWLEVTGEIGIKAGKKYQIGFKVSFKKNASGWNQAPLFISAKVGDEEKTTWKRIKSLEEKLPEEGEMTTIPGESDGELEVTVPATGDISTGTKLYFGLHEVWTGKWKTGLLIHEAFVQQVA